MKKFTQLLEDTYTSEYKIKKVMGPDGEWHDKKLRPHRIDFKNSKMHGEPAQKDSGQDVGMKEEKTTGATKLVHTRTGADGAKYHIMQDSPYDYSVHKEHKGKTTHIDTYSSLHRAKSVLDNEVKEETNMTIDEQINEVLSKDATAGDWIHDFVHSDNPKFADKSKEKRKEMALAAYYAKQRNEEVELDEAAQGHTIEAHGIRGMKSTPWRKTFKSHEHLSDWADKNDSVEVHGTRDLEQAKKGNLSPAIKEAKDEREYGYEGDMAMTQLETAIRHATHLKGMMKPDTDLPEWVQSKITLATDYLQTAHDYLMSEMNEEVKDEYARKVDKHLKNKYAPVAPVPDKKYIKGTPENLALKASRKPINGHPTNVKEGTMKSFKEIMQSLQEVNHREFAQQGKMHHDMAKHMNPGNEMDFYHPETGDKISGVVKHNSGKEVHIKANKDGKLGAGDVHKFTVTNKLDEALKGSQHKLDKNKNGKVDSGDFKMLRGEQCPECGKAPCECGSMKEAAYAGLEKEKKMGLPTAIVKKSEKAVEGDTVEGWDHPHKAVKKEEVETRTVSFKDFINEIKMADLPKRTVKGSSYGAQYHDPEGDDAFDRKPKQVAKPEPEVKRGRGRPAGSKSGANQKVTSGTKRSGVDYSGYKLHLPNSNR